MVLVFVFFPVKIFAELPENLRKNFSDFVADLCFSSQKFNLDEKFLDAKKNFQREIDGIFSDAFGGAINKINEKNFSDFAKKIKISDFENWQKLDFGAENLQRAQSAQKNSAGEKFVSSCAIADPFSSCRVAETVLNEFCGYRTFLWAKIRDDESFSAEIEQEFTEKNEAEKFSLFEFRAKKFSERQKNYENEIKKTRRAILDTLFLYKNFAQNYELQTQMLIFLSQLDAVESQFLRPALEAFQTFRAKFENSSR